MRQSGVWSWWCRVRLAAVVCAGLWCVVLGAGVTGALVEHGSLGRAGTLTLLGAVGMLVLPGLTVLAARLDGRVRARIAAANAAPVGRVAHPAHPHDGARREPRAHRARGRSETTQETRIRTF